MTMYNYCVQLLCTKSHGQNICHTEYVKYVLTYFESIKVPPRYMKMFNTTRTGRPY